MKRQETDKKDAVATDTSRAVWTLVGNRRIIHVPESSMVYDLDRFLEYKLDPNSLVARVTIDPFFDLEHVDAGVYFTNKILPISEYQTFGNLKANPNP